MAAPNNLEFSASKLADTDHKEGRRLVLLGYYASPESEAALAEFCRMPRGERLHVIMFRVDDDGNPIT